MNAQLSLTCRLLTRYNEEKLKEGHVMKNKILACLLAVVVTLSLVGCGQSNEVVESSDGAEEVVEAEKVEEVESSEKIELSAFLLSEDEIRLDLYNNYYAPNVENDLPHLEVEFELPGVGYQDKLRIYNASGELPDVFFGWNVILESGNALDLTPYIEADGFIDNFKNPGSLIPYSDGNIYAISSGADAYYTSALMYNTTLFEAEGIEIPTNFDELVTVCEQFATKGYSPISIMGSFTAYAMLPQDLITMESVDDIKLLNSGEIGFDSEAFVEAMTKFQRLVDADAFPADAATIGYDDHIALFTTGKSPMIYAPLWVYPSIQDMEGLDFMYLPTFSQEPNHLNGWGQAYGGYMVSKNTEHPEEAVELAEWMVKQDAEYFAIEMGSAIGYDVGVEPELPPISKSFYDLFNSEDVEVIPNFASNYLSDSVKAEMLTNIGNFLTKQMDAETFCTTMETLRLESLE